jgi:Spy/CpxP family protein refolding chaperone
VAMRAKFDLMMEKGAEVHKLMKGAADQFAAVLDPEQQRKFADAILPHPMMGMPGMRPPG